MAVVFVYGTLTDPTQVSTLLETYTFGPSAVCRGLRRVDGMYPTLAPGDQVAGRLLSTPELDRLDSYEALDSGLYCRVSVPLRSARGTDSNRTQPDGSAFDVDTAEVYIGNPTAVGVAEPVDWPETDPFRQCVLEYIGTNNIRIEIQNPESRRKTTER